jgi:hypothetical protein
MQITSLSERPRVQLLSAQSVRDIARDVLAANARWVWVEGFSAAGKSDFAASLAHRLEWQHIELDDLTVDTPPVRAVSYADFMDREKLSRCLGSSEKRHSVVLDGICLREVLSRINAVEEAYVVYIARVSQPTTGALLWHDGLDMERPTSDTSFFTLSTIWYHRELRPYDDARRILLRIGDEPPKRVSAI